MQYSTPISQGLKKLVRSLHQKQHREQNSLFIAEGEKLCSELLNSDYEPELILIRDQSSSDVLDIAKVYVDRGVPIYNAPKHQFDQLSETKSPQGIIAVVNTKESEITPNESFIALESVQDPGNVGTIIRTADWFGIKQIIINSSSADHYNPKTVRATMGSIFRVNIIPVDDLTETINQHFNKIETYSAIMDSKTNLDKIKPNKKFGLVFGNESKGISQKLRDVVKKDFTIEGITNAESLNVSIAVGISLYHFSKNTK